MILLVSGRPDMANGRGHIWGLSVSLLKSLPLWRMFTGVGPNCYMYALNDYLAVHTEDATAFAERFRGLALTSAHSELFDYLINMGVFGLLTYVGFVASLIGSYLNGKIVRSTGADISFVCIISYVIYSAFNFSIICATPMFFICCALLMATSCTAENALD